MTAKRTDRVSEPRLPDPLPLGRIRDLTLGGLFVALGIALPVVFHAVGGAGPVFLPMHLPVLVCGLLTGWDVALIVGLVTPLLSGLLTGMPPIMPTAVIMSVELGTLGVAAALARRAGLGVWPATIAAVALRLLTRPLLFVLVVPLLGVRATFWEFVVLTVLPSWPGIAMQVIVVPGIVMMIERQRIIGPPAHKAKE